MIQEPDLSQERRLSPLVLAVRPLRSLRQTAIPILLVLVVGHLSEWSLIAAAGGLGWALGEALLHWLRTTYRLDGDRLRVKRGLIGQRMLSIPLDRVRGVELTASPIQRALGLSVVRIDAALSERREEGTLDALPLAEAERLRSILLHRAGADVTAEGEESAPPLASLRPRWILYAPLAGESVIPITAIIIRFAFSIADQLHLFGGSRRLLSLVERDPLLLIPAVVAVLVFLAVVATVWFAILNWEFTLRERDGSLVSERGLLTRRGTSLERRRIRGWELLESPLERLAGVARLRAVVTGIRSRQGQTQLLPIGPREEVLRVAAAAVSPFHAELIPHPRAGGRRLVRAVVPPLAVTLATLPLHLDWLTAVLALVTVLGVPLALDRHRSLGHADDGTRLSVREGSLRRRQVVIAHQGLIGWSMHQTLFQRRVGLCTLSASVGAGRGGYAAQDVTLEEAVRFAAEVTPSWLAPLLESRSGPPHRPPDLGIEQANQEGDADQDQRPDRGDDNGEDPAPAGHPAQTVEGEAVEDGPDHGDADDHHRVVDDHQAHVRRGDTLLGEGLVQLGPAGGREHDRGLLCGEDEQADGAGGVEPGQGPDQRPRLGLLCLLRRASRRRRQRLLPAFGAAPPAVSVPTLEAGAALDAVGGLVVGGHLQGLSASGPSGDRWGRAGRASPGLTGATSGDYAAHRAQHVVAPVSASVLGPMTGRYPAASWLLHLSRISFRLPVVGASVNEVPPVDSVPTHG